VLNGILARALNQSKNLMACADAADALLECENKPGRKRNKRKKP